MTELFAMGKALETVEPLLPLVTIDALTKLEYDPESAVVGLLSNSFFGNHILFRLRDFVGDMTFILRVAPALGFWALSGACQGICFLLFYLSVQNGPQVPGMVMHFMWPFVFAVSNALFPSTWEQRSSGYELKVVVLGLFGVWFLMQSGIAIGEHSGIGLGKAPLMLAGLVSAIFGCANAVCDYHALTRSRGRRVEIDAGARAAGDVSLFRVADTLPVGLRGDAPALAWVCAHTPLLPPRRFWRHFGSGHDRAVLARLRRLFRRGFLFRLHDDPCLRICAAGLHLPASAVRRRLPLSWRGAYRPADGVRRADHPAGHVPDAGGHQGLDGQHSGAFPLYLFEHHRAAGARDAEHRRRTLGDGEGVNAEVMAGVFAIVISFLLSRLLDRNKSENELEIENVNVMGEIIVEAGKTLKDETVLLKLKNLAYRLSVYILDFDVNTAQLAPQLLDTQD